MTSDVDLSKSNAVSTSVSIFIRVRPVPYPSDRFEFDPAEGRVSIAVPRDPSAGYVNHRTEHHPFNFNGIIGPEAKQDEVFERVARGPVMSALQGINGTVFAYGQTGSGKTFTITGGMDRYVDRGLTPRTLSLLFSEISQRADWSFVVRVSYIEIYNDTGYDLLDPERETRGIEDIRKLQKVRASGDFRRRGGGAGVDSHAISAVRHAVPAVTGGHS